ncbi:MAG: hypothetical protein ACI9W2_003467 [Gammaproteobacteria bacterium]|jgi:hypothetical protein
MKTPNSLSNIRSNHPPQAGTVRPTPSVRALVPTARVQGPGKGLSAAMSALALVKPGQLINAAVVRAGAAVSVLALGGHNFSARTQVPLRVGEILTLRRQPGANVPTFAVLTRGAALLARAELAASSGLRQSLPIQLPLGQAIGRLRTLSNTLSMLGNNDAGALGRAPTGDMAGLRHELNALLGTVPRRDQLTDPATLARQIRDSGVFLESKLRTLLLASAAASGGLSAPGSRSATATPSGSAGGPGRNNSAQGLLGLALGLGLAPDMKRGLLRLAELANQQHQASDEPSTANLRRDIGATVEAALSRLRVLQLSNAQMPTEEANVARFGLEIPVASPMGTTEHVTLLVERETENAQGSETGESRKIWRIVLQVDTPQIGLVEANVTVRDETVSARFVAQRPESAIFVRENLPRLESALSKLGLRVEALSCLHGVPRDTASPRGTRAGTTHANPVRLVHLVI